MRNNNTEGIFHVHSTYSYDGELTPEELRKECIKRNLKFMVLTEHAIDFDSNKMKEFVSNCEKISNNGFLAIPGLEFDFERERDLHILAVGIRNFPNDPSLESIIKEIHAQGGLAVVAHLSRNNHFIPKKIWHKIDGIEIWNASYDSRYLPDARAINLCKKLKKSNRNLRGFVGLDLHDRRGFRDLRILVAQDYRNVDELLGHLKSGRFENHGKHIAIPSSPETGIFLLALFRVGRVFLNIADMLKWKCNSSAILDRINRIVRIFWCR